MAEKRIPKWPWWKITVPTHWGTVNPGQHEEWVLNWVIEREAGAKASRRPGEALGFKSLNSVHFHLNHGDGDCSIGAIVNCWMSHSNGNTCAVSEADFEDKALSSTTYFIYI